MVEKWIQIYNYTSLHEMHEGVISPKAINHFFFLLSLIPNGSGLQKTDEINRFKHNVESNSHYRGKCLPHFVILYTNVRFKPLS